ncbi:MAG: hypothetical protein AAGC67_15995 [Myxococcota bacterium]
MTRPRHFAAALATSIALAAAPASAQDNTVLADTLETVGTVWTGLVDIALLRPLGAGRLALGAVVGMPFSSTLNLVMLPVGQQPDVFAEDWDRYVVEPYEYVFVRRVGKDLTGL